MQRIIPTILCTLLIGCTAPPSPAVEGEVVPPATRNAEPVLPSDEVVMDLPSLPKLSRAPELTGLDPWHNSDPLTLAELRGKVVLVDFWTYSCINCIRTFPALRGYYEKFQDQPFVLLGVHAPEFAFEKLESNVADAIKRNNLNWPIAQDNDFQTWRAFANRYWPAKYLVDAEGYIRYTHFGEGEYEETDLAIQSLLAEIGASVVSDNMPEEEEVSRRNRSPEIYLGSRSWPALGNPSTSSGGPGSVLPTDEVVTYEAPGSLTLNKYYLSGEWQMRDQERQVLLSDEGTIRIKFLGSEMNLVLGLEEGTDTVDADIEVNGEHTQSFNVDKNELFNLYSGEYGEHEVILRLHGKGVAGYAFTFGAN